MPMTVLWTHWWTLPLLDQLTFFWPHLQIPLRQQRAVATTTTPPPKLVPWRSAPDWTSASRASPQSAGTGRNCASECHVHEALFQCWELHMTYVLSHLRHRWRWMVGIAVLFTQTGGFFCLLTRCFSLPSSESLILSSFICRFILRPCQYLRPHSVQ